MGKWRQGVTGMNVFGILKTATISFCQRPWLMQYLIGPLVLQFAGFYGSILISFYMMAWAISMGSQGDLNMAIGFSLVVFVVGLLGLGLFMKGFWDLLVLFVTLNTVSEPSLDRAAVNAKLSDARERLKPQKSAYSIYLFIIMMVQIVVAVLGVIPFIPLTLIFMNDPVKLNWINDLCAVILTLAMLVVYTPFSYGFQILAFSPERHSGTQLVQESLATSRGYYWQGLVLLIISVIVTVGLLPSAIEWVLRLTSIIQPLDSLHEWIMSQWLHAVKDMPGTELLTQIYTEQLPEMASKITHDCLVFLISTLLLPWGTLVYARLYLDIQAAKSANL